MKKINLKKQLAFVSSLVLIAGTAIYMPENVGEFIGSEQNISVTAETTTVPKVTLNGKECTLSTAVGTGELEDPYTCHIGIDNADYGETMDYAFTAPDGWTTVSGSKGTVTFDSDDGNAETGLYQVDKDGTKKYYRAVFIVKADLSFYDELNTVGKTVGITMNNGTKLDNFPVINFANSDKVTPIDGHYVKTCYIGLPADIKAKSKVTVDFGDLSNGYAFDKADNKFEVTLDEKGNAYSDVIKISSTWDGQDKVEYVRFKFGLNVSNEISTINGLDEGSFSADFEAEGDKYVRVYTVRDTAPASKKAECVIPSNSVYEYLFHVVTNADNTCKLDVDENGATDTVELYAKNIGENDGDIYSSTRYYYKIVFNPEYTLTFYDNDGETILAEQTETVGETYTLPENPTKEGYIFAGWYLDKEHSEDKRLYDGMEVAQAHGTEAYAKWTPITYTVKLDANGGTAETDSNKLVGWNISSYGTSVQLSGVEYDTEETIASRTDLVKKDGYNLIGFSTDKNATVPDENLSFLDKDGNISSDKWISFSKLTTEDNSTVTLYAVWRAEECSVQFITKQILIDDNDEKVKKILSNNLELEKNLIYVPYDSKFGELPVPELKGFNFEGWYYQSTDGKKWIKATANTVLTPEIAQSSPFTLTAYFTPSIYTITYEDMNYDNKKTISFGGSGSSTYIMPFSIKYDLKGEITYFKDNKATDEKGAYDNIDLEKNVEEKKDGYKLLGYTVNGIVKDDFSETKSYFDLGEISQFINGYDNLTYKTSATKSEKISIKDLAQDITIKAIWEVDDTQSIINVDYDDAIISYTNAKGNAVTIKPTSSSYEKFPSKITGTPGDRIQMKCEIDGDDGVDYITFTNYGFDVDDIECRLIKDGYAFAGWFTKDADGNEVAFTNTKFTAGITNVYAKWTKLTAPENVAVDSNGKVTWTGGEGAAYFRVYKVYNGITKNAKTTSSPYTFQNLTEGVEHEIYVIAYDGNGNSIKSESVKFTPSRKSTLTAPTNVKVDADGKVTWTAAENAAYYKVSKVVNGKTSTGKQVTGTEYTFQYIAKGVEHEIYVTAFDKDGNSLKSESIKFTSMTAPANVKVSEDGTVTWTKSEGAAYYRVYKKYGKTTKNAKVDATATSYTFQNLTEGVKHEIYVIAFDANGNQYKSESVMFTPEKKATLTAPTNVKVDADGNVTWTAAENAAYYKVSKVVAGKTYTGKQTTDTKYTFVSFNPGQNKTVFVTAFDKDGNSIKSETVTVKAVENIKVTTAGVVTFDKVDGASYYRVYKEYNGTTKSAKTTASPYTFQTFTKGVKHDVYVKAYNASGKEIAISKTVTVTAK